MRKVVASFTHIRKGIALALLFALGVQYSGALPILSSDTPNRLQHHHQNIHHKHHSNASHHHAKKFSFQKNLFSRESSRNQVSYPKQASAFLSAPSQTHETLAKLRLFEQRHLLSPSALGKPIGNLVYSRILLLI